jgi:REP element-mobilizing transposase RayT
MEEDFPCRKHLTRIPIRLPSHQRVLYFITVCCFNRRTVFDNDHAVKIALESLSNCADATDWKVWQICFMPDHVHLMISPLSGREQMISKVIQRWKSSSKQRLNRAGVEGVVWQREFFDRLLRSDESLTDKWRYVEMNPVRAGLCDDPAEFRYLGAPDKILGRLKASLP